MNTHLKNVEKLKQVKIFRWDGKDMLFILALLKSLLLHQGFETIKIGSSVFNEKLHIIELSNNSKLQIIENSAFYQSSIE